MAEDDIDYDELYKTLGLPFGSKLDAIQTAWKELAKKLHPDNFNAGPLRDAAHERIVLVNDARDKLKEYWHTHDAPPPTKKRKRRASARPPRRKKAKSPPPASRKKSSKSPPPGKKASGAAPDYEPPPDDDTPLDDEDEPSPPPRQDKTWQEETYDAWKREYERRKQEEHRRSKTASSGSSASSGSTKSDTSTPPPAPEQSKPFGPPPFKKYWYHHIYDFTHVSENPLVPATFILLYAAICTGVSMALLNFLIGSTANLPAQFWYSNPTGIAASFGVALPFMLLIAALYNADCDLYVVRANPYLRPHDENAKTTLDSILSFLSENKFAGYTWKQVSSNFDYESDSYEVRFSCKLSSSYEAILNLSIQFAGNESCMVTYWFDLEPIPAWCIPLARLVRRTDTALWKLLS